MSEFIIFHWEERNNRLPDTFGSGLSHNGLSMLKFSVPDPSPVGWEAPIHITLVVGPSEIDRFSHLYMGRDRKYKASWMSRLSLALWQLLVRI